MPLFLKCFSLFLSLVFVTGCGDSSDVSPSKQIQSEKTKTERNRVLAALKKVEQNALRTSLSSPLESMEAVLIWKGTLPTEESIQEHHQALTDYFALLTEVDPSVAKEFRSKRLAGERKLMAHTLDWVSGSLPTEWARVLSNFHNLKAPIQRLEEELKALVDFRPDGRISEHTGRPRVHELRMAGEKGQLAVIAEKFFEYFTLQGIAYRSWKSQRFFGSLRETSAIVMALSKAKLSAVLANRGAATRFEYPIPNS